MSDKNQDRQKIQTKDILQTSKKNKGYAGEPNKGHARH